MQTEFPISLESAEFYPIQCVTATDSCQRVQIIDPEFSSVCPKTGLPDYGRVILTYQPKCWLVELKAWKLYLRSFYGVGIMHEPVTNKILTDFVEQTDPNDACLIIDWGARGGLKTITGLAWVGGNFTSCPDDEVFRDARRNWTNT